MFRITSKHIAHVDCFHYSGQTNFISKHLQLTTTTATIKHDHIITVFQELLLVFILDINCESNVIPVDSSRRV